MWVDISPEECARRILQRELSRPVLLHDDGSRPQMYDLRVGDENQPDIAIECTGAVDQQRTETWNVGPGKGSFVTSIPGQWYVVLRPDARVRRVKASLSAVLESCAHFGVSSYTSVDAFLQIRNSALYDRLSRLKIAAIGCYVTDEPGRVYLGMTSIGGAVDSSGGEIPTWISEFLRSEGRQDVVVKLQRARAKECHAFVIVSFGGVPWAVESYLGTDTNMVPQAKPDLPAPIEAVWIMYGPKGLRWDGSKWAFFDALIPNLEQS